MICELEVLSEIIYVTNNCLKAGHFSNDCRKETNCNCGRSNKHCLPLCLSDAFSRTNNPRNNFQSNNRNANFQNRNGSQNSSGSGQSHSSRHANSNNRSNQNHGGAQHNLIVQILMSQKGGPARSTC